MLQKQNIWSLNVAVVLNWSLFFPTHKSVHDIRGSWLRHVDKLMSIKLLGGKKKSVLKSHRPSDIIKDVFFKKMHEGWASIFFLELLQKYVLLFIILVAHCFHEPNQRLEGGGIWGLLKINFQLKKSQDIPHVTSEAQWALLVKRDETSAVVVSIHILTARLNKRHPGDHNVTWWQNLKKKNGSIPDSWQSLSPYYLYFILCLAL